MIGKSHESESAAMKYASTHEHRVRRHTIYSLSKNSSPILNKPIAAGTPYANYLGFSANRFKGYLWDDGSGAIIINLITVKQPGQGHFSKLIKDIEKAGKTVAIPSPFGEMQTVLLHRGFAGAIDPESGVKVWTRRAAL